MKKPKVSHILSLAALMAIATACKKQTDPNSNNTNDPVIPTREIVIDWNCNATLAWVPPIDTVRYYIEQNDVKSVTIHLFGRAGPDYPINCSTFRPSMFCKGRKQIEPCVYLDPRVKLSGGIRTPRDDFTSNSDTILEYGIASFDKAWFEKYGMTFFIGHVSTSK